MSITFKLNLTWKGILVWWKHYPKFSLKAYKDFFKASWSIWRAPNKQNWGLVTIITPPKIGPEEKHEIYERIKAGERRYDIRNEILENSPTYCPKKVVVLNADI